MAPFDPCRPTQAPRQTIDHHATELNAACSREEEMRFNIYFFRTKRANFVCSRESR